MTAHFAAVLLGGLLDLLLGDPHRLPHPVRAMGALIAGLESPLRRLFPSTQRGELLAGAMLVLLVVLLSTGAAVLLLLAAYLLSPLLAFLVEAVLCYYCLAARSLREESMAVFRALTGGTIEEARRAVSMIVGRDTDRLDADGVTRAAVETVAENASDGVIAPLLFLAVGGAPLGILYKAVNTMDSMVGYQNERYLYFGRCAARLDDVLNFLPARLAGVLLCLAAPIASLRGQNAWRIFFRDRKNHKSPNSAHTEAAAAGALGVRLAGSNYYFGKIVDKPTIGDDLRPIVPEDIPRVNRLMLTAFLLSLLLFAALPLALSLL